MLKPKNLYRWHGGQESGEWKHIDNLINTLEIMRSYNMHLKPNKCSFGVHAEKLLGFMLTRRWIKTIFLDLSDLLMMIENHTWLSKSHIIISLINHKCFLGHISIKYYLVLDLGRHSLPDPLVISARSCSSE